MGIGNQKASRGRPKTFNRERTLEIAMQLYWREGIDGVSVNEICQRAEVSKPSLYREFGNEDGLMKAAIIHYQKNVLEPVFALLKNEVAFRETLNQLIEINTEVVDVEAPKGCLFVKMRASRLHVGEETREQIDVIQKSILDAYQSWIDDAKDRGEISTNIDSKFAANYLSSQFGNAKAQQARGENAEEIRAILEMALSVLLRSD